MGNTTFPPSYCYFLFSFYHTYKCSVASTVWASFYFFSSYVFDYDFVWYEFFFTLFASVEYGAHSSVIWLVEPLFKFFV